MEYQKNKIQSQRVKLFDDYKPLKREVRIRKKEDVDFGFELCRIGSKVYVIKVDKFDEKFQVTPAYRSGLRFGDELLHIDEIEIKKLTIKEIHIMLKYVDNVVLTVQDPIEKQVFVEREYFDLGIIGIWCDSGSKIGRVCKSSPSFRSGITSEMTITKIQGKLQLGKCSNSVNRTLKKEWDKVKSHKNKHGVYISVMPTNIIRVLLQLAYQIMVLTNYHSSLHNFILENLN